VESDRRAEHDSTSVHTRTTTNQLTDEEGCI
jgi:hypothetical protein